MSRREEINPTEMFYVSDRVILVDEYESILGDMFKFGAEGSQAGYIFSFKGKLNNKDERDEVTVVMPIRDAWNLFNDVLKGMELFRKANEKRDT